MSTDVDKLGDLQQVVSQLAEHEKQLEIKPESFATVDREYQLASEEMQKLEQSLEVISKERRRVDGELQDEQELLKKYQGQLMLVKNQQQYAAAWKEIDGTRKHVKELEDSVLKSMAEADGVQKELDERRSGFDDLKGRYDTAHAAWQASLSELRSEIEQLRTRQEQIEAGLPKNLTREFWRIARQRQGVAVARVAGATCTGCRTRIRPALSQRLKRGELVNCEGCSRILFLERSES